MISYIAATNDRAVLEANLLDTVYLQDGDELILVENPPSIAVAYNEGAADASNRIRCYVHADMRIVDPQRLRQVLLIRCTPEHGIVGLIGSRDRAVPWWHGRRCGSVIDARHGLLDFGRGGPCSYLDGMLLATARDVEWDESYPGFHLYDHDICEQMIQRGLPNWCLNDGAEMAHHNTRSPGDTALLDGWDVATARFRQKWGLS